MAKTSFNDFSFHHDVYEVIDKLNFREPTEIQEKVIPHVLEGRSIVGQSYTGSGKTHAYLLPLFDQLDTSKQDVQMVLTAPTRELASQIYEEVKKIIHFAEKDNEWRARLLIGGTDKQKMDAKLKTSPQIIVGTPGRILDHVKDNTLSIYSAKSLVIDEADLMLDMGFIEEIDQLLVRTTEQIQLLVFSATIPKRLWHFFKKYLKNPVYSRVDDSFVPEALEHRLIHLKHRDEAKRIQEISQVIQPYLAIIFTNSKEKADELAEQLQSYGLDTGLLHGGLSPRQRKRMLKEIRNLRYQYIVATDLASRGIDIEGISHVINAQLPKEEDFYLHRVGRTARAGLKGTAISLYDDNDIPLIKKLEERGLPFIYSDVKQGQWTSAKPWNERTQKRSGKHHSHLEREAWKQVKKPKKVKPGYKKRMRQEQEKIKKEMVRKKSGKKRT